jgi:hypothetical protein
MRTHSRPFDPAGRDFEQLWHFLQRDTAERQDRFVWLVSRLGDWKYGLWSEPKYIPAFFREHCQVWLDAFDQVAGAVLSEDGGNVVFFFAPEHNLRLYAEIVDWTAEHWRARWPTLITEVPEHQAAALAVLERRGWRRAEAVATTRAYAVRAQAAEPLGLADGFCIVDMAAAPDYTAKAGANNDGFSGLSQVSAFELQRYAYSRENPAYDPALDYSVVAPDGTHVASCVGFVDPASRLAEIEKVCTRAAYRRQGHAQAAIRACFRGLAERGVERAYITAYGPGANALYARLGPVAEWQWYHYELGGA